MHRLPARSSRRRRSTVAEAYADPGRAPRRRPAVAAVNMIASVDGATAVEGRSGGLGRRRRPAVFHVLRSLADVVLVGAATARAERYGPPRRAGQRIAVVTASGRPGRVRRRCCSPGAAIVVTTEDGPDCPRRSPSCGPGRARWTCPRPCASSGRWAPGGAHRGRTPPERRAPGRRPGRRVVRHRRPAGGERRERPVAHGPASSPSGSGWPTCWPTTRLPLHPVPLAALGRLAPRP